MKIILMLLTCYFSLLKLFENILDFKYGIWSKVGGMQRMKRDRGTDPTCCCTMIGIRL